MNEDREASWSQDYRGLALVPIARGDSQHGYTAAFKVNHAMADGEYETLAAQDCPGRHRSEGEAREAAIDAAQAWGEATLAAG